MQSEKYIHCTLNMYETKFKLFLEPLKNMLTTRRVFYLLIRLPK